jgi:hypothetical protein
MREREGRRGFERLGREGDPQKQDGKYHRVV